MAVRPPEAVLDAIAERVAGAADAGTGLRWQQREQWHLTLKFLGPVALVAPVLEGLSSASAACAPFTFRVGGPGAFPNAGRARVVWLGPAEGAGPMRELAASVGSALGPVGYPPEDRPYNPHLTVARLKTPTGVRGVLETLGPEPVGPAWTVEEIVLYESRPSASGANYAALGRFPLASRTPPGAGVPPDPDGDAP